MKLTTCFSFPVLKTVLQNNLLQGTRERAILMSEQDEGYYTFTTGTWIIIIMQYFTYCISNISEKLSANYYKNDNLCLWKWYVLHFILKYKSCCTTTNC